MFASASLHYMPTSGFGWTCTREEQQPQLPSLCVVPGVLSCAIFAARCEIRVLLLRASIICLFRSCVTVYPA